MTRQLFSSFWISSSRSSIYKLCWGILNLKELITTERKNASHCWPVASISATGDVQTACSPACASTLCQHAGVGGPTHCFAIHDSKAPRTHRNRGPCEGALDIVRYFLVWGCTVAWEICVSRAILVCSAAGWRKGPCRLLLQLWQTFLRGAKRTASSQFCCTTATVAITATAWDEASTKALSPICNVTHAICWRSGYVVIDDLGEYRKLAADMVKGGGRERRREVGKRDVAKRGREDVGKVETDSSRGST